MSTDVIATDPSKAKAAAAGKQLVIRDGKLKTVYIARVSLPNLKPVWVARDGKILEFESRSEAEKHARKVAREWRESAAAGKRISF